MKFFKIILIVCILGLLFLSVKAISSRMTVGEPISAEVTKVDDISFEPPVVEEEKTVHMKAPENLRGIYVTANSFLYKPFKVTLDNLIDTTTINALVIDIKDAPGTIDYDIGFDTPCVKPIITNEQLREKLEYYHSKGMYLIARVAVMRDECFVKNNLELAAVKKDGTPWRDGSGHYWLSPHELATADYIVEIGKAVYESGFDEIQLDYVRYPSDGQMALLNYEFSDDVIATSTIGMKRRQTMKNFVAHVREGLGEDIPLSADVFGLVLPAKDDLGIGQYLEDLAPHLDYVSAMIYPSHFNKNWNNLANTHTMPYETIYQSTKMGLDRMNVQFGTTTAIAKMRPWLQDFSIFGVVYNAPEVKAQIKALDDLGVKSFLLWNASNRYTKGVLSKE